MGLQLMWEVIELTLAFIGVVIVVGSIVSFFMLFCIGWFLNRADRKAMEKRVREDAAWKAARDHQRANSTKRSGTR